MMLAAALVVVACLLLFLGLPIAVGKAMSLNELGDD
jgi:ABC-type spermidine/putrescine transport system permease subunit II